MRPIFIKRTKNSDFRYYNESHRYYDLYAINKTGRKAMPSSPSKIKSTELSPLHTITYRDALNMLPFVTRLVKYILNYFIEKCN